MGKFFVFLLGRTVDLMQAAGFTIVALAMLEMFTISPNYFQLGSIVSTISMVAVTILLTKYKGLFKPTVKSLLVGLASAVLLYAVFYAGNVGINVVKLPIGSPSSNESEIYSLIARGPLAIRIVVLLLDALGFESYFRGNFLNYLRIKTRIGSVFVVAAIDALIHIVTLNPLFPITTFIADSTWGLVYWYTKDLTASFASHLAWDIAIFIVFPV